jgi:hypothetical protein
MTERPTFLKRTEDRGDIALAIVVVVLGSLAAAGGLHLLLRLGAGA